MNDIEMMWATVAVPYEAYRRGERIRVPRDLRNASLAVQGYLLVDPVIVEVLVSTEKPVRRTRGTRKDQQDEVT